MIVRNQTYLRKKNKEEILTLLREKTCSYSELARAMCLSNAAIAKIAEDLIVDGVIQRESETKGRTGINLSINADYGYVFAVDFSKWRVEFCAADFNGKTSLCASNGQISLRHKNGMRQVERKCEYPFRHEHFRTYLCQRHQPQDHPC